MLLTAINKSVKFHSSLQHSRFEYVLYQFNHSSVLMFINYTNEGARRSKIKRNLL